MSIKAQKCILILVLVETYIHACMHTYIHIHMPAGCRRAYRCRMRGVTDQVPCHVCPQQVSIRAPCICLRAARHVQVNITHIAHMNISRGHDMYVPLCWAYFPPFKLVSFSNPHNVGITSRVTHFIIHLLHACWAYCLPHEKAVSSSFSGPPQGLASLIARTVQVPVALA